MISNDIPAGRYCGECPFNREDGDNTGYLCTLIDNVLESWQDQSSGLWDILRDEECKRDLPYGGAVRILAKAKA